MKRGALAVGVVALVAVAVVIALRGPVPEERLSDGGLAPVRSEEAAAPERPVDPRGDLPEGTLAPIPGDPRPDDTRFCDEEMWRGAGALVREVDPPHRVVVDEADWLARTSSAHAGLASWLSKCHLGGAWVEIRGDATDRLLGRYDPEVGYSR